MSRTTMPSAMPGHSSHQRRRSGTCRRLSGALRCRATAELLDALASHLDLELLVEEAVTDPVARRSDGRLCPNGTRAA